MDREGCHATVRGVPKNWTWLGNWTENLLHLDLPVSLIHPVMYPNFNTFDEVLASFPF